jgi:two-component system NtrC family response regulator
MNLAMAMDMCNLSTVPKPVDTKAAADPIAGASGILVVEDDAVIRDLLTMILQQRGYSVRVAVGGNEARRLIATERPALILSDLRMPEGDGWALLDYCHRNVPDVPVILISGSDFGTYPQIESWAASHLAKPFSSEQLSFEVERILPRALHGC